MKKIIRIEISYPDCDILNITAADLMVIQNEVLNQCSIVEDVAEGRFEIDAKIIESLDEEELNKLASDYSAKIHNQHSNLKVKLVDGLFLNDTVTKAYKAGYHKSWEDKK